jgi:prepilin-type N-terminal cleavage/methylation domain-containing protein
MDDRGYTLIETTAVAVILSILLAVTVPAVTRYRASMKGVQAREQLVQDLRAARQKAVTQRAPVVVAFGNGVSTTNITSYTVHTDGNADRVVQSAELRLNRTLPTETKLELVSLAPTDSLIFDISGVLWPSTTGGTLIVASKVGFDTLVVSAAGMVYRR